MFIVFGRRPHSPFEELWTGVETGMPFLCCPIIIIIIIIIIIVIIVIVIIRSNSSSSSNFQRPLTSTHGVRSDGCHTWINTGRLSSRDCTPDYAQ